MACNFINGMETYDNVHAEKEKQETGISKQIIAELKQTGKQARVRLFGLLRKHYIDSGTIFKVCIIMIFLQNTIYKCIEYIDLNRYLWTQAV